MTGDSENSLYSVCFKPVNLLPVGSLLFSLFVCASVRVCWLFLRIHLSPFTSHPLNISHFLSFLIFSFSFFFSFFHHALLLCHLSYSSSAFLFSFILWFCDFSVNAAVWLFVFCSLLCSHSLWLLVFDFPLSFVSPPLPHSPSLLSFSPTLFILILPSALYKLDWWLNLTCIKVRITIFAPAHTHTHIYTHRNGSRQLLPYSHTLSLCLPPTHTHTPFFTLANLTFTK